MIIGFGIPVPVQRSAVILGIVIKANYNTPTNITQLQYQDYNGRRERRSSSLSRWDIYAMLARESEM